MNRRTLLRVGAAATALPWTGVRAAGDIAVF